VWTTHPTYCPVLQKCRGMQYFAIMLDTMRVPKGDTSNCLIQLLLE
jgi:hypothetical protein